MCEGWFNVLRIPRGWVIDLSFTPIYGPVGNTITSSKVKGNTLIYTIIWTFTFVDHSQVPWDVVVSTCYRRLDVS